jgi:glycosyltransferase involved in cell wall biosynthesis
MPVGMPSICLVNLFHLHPPSNGGVSRVAKYVCKLLLEQGPFSAENIVFAVGARFASEFPDWLGYKAERLVVVPCPEFLGIPELFRRWRPHLIVSPLFGCDPFTPPAVSPQIPHIASIPDTFFLDCPEDFDPHRRKQLRTTYSALSGASRVVTFSEFMRRRLLEYLQLDPARVHVAPQSVSYVDNLGSTHLNVRSLQPYLFYPANDWKHKRHEFLLRIIKVVWNQRPDIKVVLTGYRAGLLGKLLDGETELAKERIIDLGYLDEGSIAELYRNAEALLLVSNYEGFGLPILEAMSYGCPVLCGHSTAIPEVAGDAALYVDSDKPEDWAHAVLADLPRRREELIVAGYARVKAFSERNTRNVAGCAQNYLIKPGAAIHRTRRAVAGDLGPHARSRGSTESMAAVDPATERERSRDPEAASTRVESHKGPA